MKVRRKKTKCLLISCLLFILLTLPPHSSFSAEIKKIKIGYAYGLELYQENETIKQTLQALESRIAEVEFQLIPLSPINTISEIDEQNVDYLIAPSIFLVEFRGMAPFTHLATRINANGNNATKTVGSTIIVRNDRDDLKTLKDLRGKKIAASSPNSLGGWLAALREIRQRGYDPDNFFSSVYFAQFQTPDVISSVLNGDVDAGILTTCVLEKVESLGLIEKGILKVIGEESSAGNDFNCRRSTADLYPDMSFVALSGASESLTRQIVITLLSMPPFDGLRWSVDHDQFSIEQLMKDLGLGPYSYLKDTSLKGLVKRFKNELLVVIAALLFLIFNELHLRHLVKKKTRALSIALEEKERANEEAALSRQRFAALEKNGIISQLGTIIAHESKQPLGTLSNYLAILKIHLSKNKNKDKFQDDILDIMSVQLERLNNLVNSVRNFAKKRQNPLIKTDLISIARKALRNFEANEPGLKKIKVGFNCDLPTAYILSEPLSLELLILNLIKNGYEEASANSPRSPLLAISISEEPDGRYSLQVENSGKNLSEKDVERIVSLGESVKPEGLGLGLSIIRGIADHFGADIQFRRRHAGGLKVSIFFVKYNVGENNV